MLVFHETKRRGLRMPCHHGFGSSNEVRFPPLVDFGIHSGSLTHLWTAPHWQGLILMFCWAGRRSHVFDLLVRCT